MKKAWLIIGIILVFSGLVVTSYGNFTREVPKLVNQPKESELNATSINDVCNKDQKMVLGIAPGKNWWLYADQSDEFMEGAKRIPLVSVTVMILDPLGKTTHLEAEYRVVEGTENLALQVVKVYNKSEGLSLKTFFQDWKSGNTTFTGEYLYEMEIGAITNYDGWYTLTVSLLGPPIPPTRLTLYRYTIEIKNDRWILIPVGAATIVVGGVMSIWAARATPRKKRPISKK